MKTTLLLLTFNQEKYIKHAMDGALNQSINELEIVISDDCSTDKTWKIINEICQNYSGPHRIVLNRNQKNLGLIENINESIDLCTGEIIILAAGDDISKINRCEEIRKKFISNTNIFAILSELETIDENCLTINQDKNYKNINNVTMSQIIVNGGGYGTGATYAYKRECFYWPSKIPSNLIAEDRILPFRAACLGEVQKINKKLVRYRIINSGLTQSIKNTHGKAIHDDKHYCELLSTLKKANAEKRFGLVQGFMYTKLLRTMPIRRNLIFKYRNSNSLARRFIFRFGLSLLNTWAIHDRLKSFIQDNGYPSDKSRNY
jgi:glycosyltransferase involved in cell wall biosynthesis